MEKTIFPSSYTEGILNISKLILKGIDYIFGSHCQCNTLNINYAKRRLLGLIG